jgi:predicted hotdog family 3-hydroxylacyl-ACP dehydratase
MHPETGILAYIPQRAPFVMIDDLISCDETSAVSMLLVRPENFFVQNGSLTEPALIENIAQTAAARIGYICKKENKPVPVGYIASVQNLKIGELPKTGDRLQTGIVIRNQVMNVTIIAGTVQVDDRLIASCEMKIFVAQ